MARGGPFAERATPWLRVVGWWIERGGGGSAVDHLAGHAAVGAEGGGGDEGGFGGEEPGAEGGDVGGRADAAGGVLRVIDAAQVGRAALVARRERVGGDPAGLDAVDPDG